MTTNTAELMKPAEITAWGDYLGRWVQHLRAVPFTQLREHLIEADRAVTALPAGPARTRAAAELAELRLLILTAAAVHEELLGGGAN